MAFFAWLFTYLNAEARHLPKFCLLAKNWRRKWDVTLGNFRSEKPKNCHVRKKRFCENLNSVVMNYKKKTSTLDPRPQESWWTIFCIILVPCTWQEWKKNTILSVFAFSKKKKGSSILRVNIWTDSYARPSEALYSSMFGPVRCKAVCLLLLAPSGSQVTKYTLFPHEYWQAQRGFCCCRGLGNK